MITWTLTAQLAVFVGVISVAGLLYARHIAHSFDRKWGRPDDPR
ncbi:MULTISPECIES: hypothetical protein [Methylobacterium]|jgi:hypothetical protein|uniref:Uncharacterized protein n=1 Tax=Methylobacterium isbiliense TaxID=315478 RepID=A0ABQ4S6U3_9HYPH|nr:hypothetical protein [Methylobacterium isbiliense]MDN3625508.1 hypothetical protein [Methylobacterium isbiliense]GJD98686.1 hypothetical protein GMJLKIPL_0597 [Methylobacterium isbiliense]